MSKQHDFFENQRRPQYPGWRPHRDTAAAYRAEWELLINGSSKQAPKARARLEGAMNGRLAILVAAACFLASAASAGAAAQAVTNPPPFPLGPYAGCGNPGQLYCNTIEGWTGIGVEGHAYTQAGSSPINPPTGDGIIYIYTGSNPSNLVEVYLHPQAFPGDGYPHPSCVASRGYTSSDYTYDWPSAQLPNDMTVTITNDENVVTFQLYSETKALSTWTAYAVNFHCGPKARAGVPGDHIPRVP